MKKSIKISLDLKLMAILLLAVILVMFAVWQPWKSAGSTRSVTVAGHARIKAEPDYYQFNPTYQRSNADRDKALSELNAHITTVTDKLKELGVLDKDIQLNTNAYDQYYPEPAKTENAVTSHLVVKAANKEMAQKIQDYLLTTGPQGNVTPAPSFSDEKREKLEDEARDKAVADAQAQALRTARQLGAKLGKVMDVKDTVGGGIVPFERGAVALDIAAPTRALPIFSGEQEISFSVEATFEIK